MAYSGFLVRIGSYTVPFKFITSGYKCGIKGNDLDSYNDADGLLQRNALENVAIKLEWNTPYMEGKDCAELMGAIRSNYIDVTEKKALVTAYMPEINGYVSMNCYVPDIEFEFDYADENGEVWFKPVRIACIGYGGTI